MQPSFGSLNLLAVLNFLSFIVAKASFLPTTITSSTSLKILHISDTHGEHDEIGTADNPQLPDADILVHTGDFTDHGGPKETKAFAKWMQNLRGVSKPYARKIVITGNHE